jgi:hypothetical protein
MLVRPKAKQFEYKPQMHQLMDFYEHFKVVSKPQSHVFSKMYFSYREGLSLLYDITPHRWHDNCGLQQAVLYGSSDLNKVINYLVYKRVDWMALKIVIDANDCIGKDIEETKRNLELLFKNANFSDSEENKGLIVLRNMDQFMQNITQRKQDFEIIFNFLQLQLEQLKNKDILVLYTAQDLSKLNEIFLQKITLQFEFDDLKERTFYFNKNLARDSKPFFKKADFDAIAAKLLLILSEGEHALALEHFNGIKSALCEIDHLLQGFYVQSKEYNLAAAAKISSYCKEIDARRMVIRDYIKTGIFADCFVGIVEDCNQEYARFIKDYLDEVTNYLFKEYYNPTPEALQYLIDNTADLDYKAIDELMKQCSLRDGAYVFTLEFIKEKIKAVKAMQEKGQFRDDHDLYDSFEKIAARNPRCIKVIMNNAPEIEAHKVQVIKTKRNNAPFSQVTEILIIAGGITVIGVTFDKICTWLKKKFANKSEDESVASQLNVSKT